MGGKFKIETHSYLSFLGGVGGEKKRRGGGAPVGEGSLKGPGDPKEWRSEINRQKVDF